MTRIGANKAASVLGDDESSPSYSLVDAIQFHLGTKPISFHCPGHKSGLGAPLFSDLVSTEVLAFDLTELPGLDDLGHPTGVLRALEKRCSRSWNAQDSVLLVNGASAGLLATMLVCARRSHCVLVPRNCHRSIVNGLVLSGLDPLWYEPHWCEDSGFWSAVSPEVIRQGLQDSKDLPAAVVVVSPTYAGRISPIASIAQVCKEFSVPLVVDEAHGSHLGLHPRLPSSALSEGADLVVHSLHKTLGALTQTGVLHLGKNSLFQVEDLRSAVNLVSSSSPSYLLMSSVDSLISQIEGGWVEFKLGEILDWREAFLANFSQVPKGFGLEGDQDFTDPLHLFFCSPNTDPEALRQASQEAGLIPETVLGRGLLYLLGLGTVESDLASLNEFFHSYPWTERTSSPLRAAKPVQARQLINPRQAFFMPSQMVAKESAPGTVSSQVKAPCPPGIPLLVPGQEILPAALIDADFDSIKVVSSGLI